MELSKGVVSVKDNTNTVIVLRQGRKLGYREYGDQQGEP